MSAQKYSMTFTPGQAQRMPAGKYFFILSALGALDIVARRQGQDIRFGGIGAGSHYGPTDQGWVFLDITSAIAQNVELIISDDGAFEVANVVTIAGSPLVQIAPSAAFVSTDVASILTGTSVDFAANLSRRRISICAASGNTDSLWVRSTAGINSGGIELQPGQTIVMETTAVIRLRNNSATTQVYSTLEES